jgi:hypothetical protein
VRLLDRLPIAGRPHLLTVRGELVEIYRNQIVVWVSINDRSRPFPALLDTGHSHNFSIGAGQLKRWTGAILEKVGELDISGTVVSQFGAELRIHANVRGGAQLSGKSHALEVPQGISVFEEGSPNAPRLPLIGLRTIIANKLTLAIDGERRQVILTTMRW